MDSASISQTAAKRVVVIEDHTAIRQMINQLVDTIPHYKVVGHTGDGKEAYQLCVELEPDLIVLDIMLPGLNGLEVLNRLKKQFKFRSLVFSGYKNEHLLRSSMSSGAHGFIEKTSSLEQLKSAIQEVGEGGTWFGKDSARLLTEALKGADRPRSIDVISPREREVLQLIAEGFSTRQIGEKLEVSVKTAENHRTNLMRKLDIHNTAALTRYAVNMGIVEGSPQLIS